MITRQMKLDLLSLGYSIKDINSFTPLHAHQILLDRSQCPTTIHSPEQQTILQNTRHLKPEECNDSEVSRFDVSDQVSNEVQSSLGKVKLKIGSSISAIDLANSAIQKAINELNQGQRRETSS